MFTVIKKSIFVRVLRLLFYAPFQMFKKVNLYTFCLPSQSENTYLNQCFWGSEKLCSCFPRVLKKLVHVEYLASFVHVFFRQLEKRKQCSGGPWHMAMVNVWCSEEPRAARGFRKHPVPTRAAHEVGGGAGHVLLTLVCRQLGGATSCLVLFPAYVAAPHKLVVWWLHRHGWWQTRLTLASVALLPLRLESRRVRAASSGRQGMCCPAP